MADADVIIIGAGMAGLTCGCLLAQKGLEGPDDREESEGRWLLHLFSERGIFLRSLCAVDGGMPRGGRVWRLLKELDLLDQIRFIPLEPAREYHFPDQKVTQSSRLETHIENLSSLFPKEREGN